MCVFLLVTFSSPFSAFAVGIGGSEACARVVESFSYFPTICSTLREDTIYPTHNTYNVRRPVPPAAHRLANPMISTFIS